MTEQILSASSSDLSNWLNELTKKLKDIPAEGDDGRSSDEIISSLFSSGDSVSISTEAKAALAELLSQMRGEKANLGLNDGQRIQFTEEDCIAYVSQRSTELQDQMAKKMAEFSAPDIDWMLGMAPIESTTQSGHKISVYAEQYEDNGELKTQMMARVDKTDGQSLLYQIMGNSVFSEDENGNVILRTTQHGLFLSDNSLTGSSGNDVIISFSAHTIEGGDGDDTIILLNNRSRNIRVDAGAGDDTIHANVVKGRIDMGDGDDTIIANEINAGYYGYGIDMGAGNDTIHADVVKGMIDMGAGNDTIHADVVNGRIDMGAGDDTIHANVVDATINMGEGNNTLHVSDYTKGLIIAGDGDNDFELGDFKIGSIDLGRGRNQVSIRSIGQADRKRELIKLFDEKNNKWVDGYAPPHIQIKAKGMTEVLVAGDASDVKFSGSVSVFVAGNINNVRFENQAVGYVAGEVDELSSTNGGAILRPNGDNVTPFAMNLMSKKFQTIRELYGVQA